MDMEINEQMKFRKWKLLNYSITVGRNNGSVGLMGGGVPSKLMVCQCHINKKRTILKNIILQDMDLLTKTLVQIVVDVFVNVFFFFLGGGLGNQLKFPVLNSNFFN